MKRVCIFLMHFSFQAVLSVMRQRNVSVDVQTFGCLALGCERQKDGLQLLKDMEVMKTHILKVQIDIRFKTGVMIEDRKFFSILSQLLLPIYICFM